MEVERGRGPARMTVICPKVNTARCFLETVRGASWVEESCGTRWAAQREDIRNYRSIGAYIGSNDHAIAAKLWC